MSTLSEQNRVPDGAPSRSVNARTKCELRAGAYLFGCVRSDGPLDVADIPGHWPRIIGVDFGYTHPFAAAELCWDRDSDCVYVTKTHRVSEQSPIYHAAALRAWGAREIPVAWPRDGRRQTLEGAGIPLAEQYRNQGLNMLFKHAQFPDGGVSVEAGLMLMLDRMKTGKLKVFRELNDFFEEFRLYHRKDGKVFAENDDIYALSATA